MFHQQAINKQAVHFDLHTQSPPSNAPPLTLRSASHGSIVNTYSHAESLFHNYEFHEAIKCYQQLIKQDQSLVSNAYLWFNIGIIRDHLGEHHRATAAYGEALKIDNTLAIAFFCLGNATFLQGNYRRALRIYKDCEQIFHKMAEETHDYHGEGLPWKLDKKYVALNIKFAQKKMEHKQNLAPLEQHWWVSRLPAGIIFGVCPDIMRRSAVVEVSQLGLGTLRPQPNAEAHLFPQVLSLNLGSDGIGQEQDVPPGFGPASAQIEGEKKSLGNKSRPTKAVGDIYPSFSVTKRTQSHHNTSRDGAPAQSGRADRLEIRSVLMFHYKLHPGATPKKEGNHQKPNGEGSKGRVQLENSGALI